MDKYFVLGYDVSRTNWRFVWDKNEILTEKRSIICFMCHRLIRLMYQRNMLSRFIAYIVGTLSFMLIRLVIWQNPCTYPDGKTSSSSTNTIVRSVIHTDGLVAGVFQQMISLTVFGTVDEAFLSCVVMDFRFIFLNDSWCVWYRGVGFSIDCMPLFLSL